MANSFSVSEKKETINNENLIDPFIEIRPDICPFCKAQRIELFSFNNYPQDYSKAVNAHLSGFEVSYNKWEIRFMKCRSCNKEFTIDWSGGFPRPLRDLSKSERFFDEFKEDK